MSKITEVKEKLLERKKDIENKLKLIEKKEKEKRLKPIINLLKKNIDKLSDDDIAMIVDDLQKKFDEKKM